MRRSHEVHLTGSVGRGGMNRWVDVAAAQQALNEHLPPGTKALAIDGDCGPLTLALIEEAQRHFHIMRQPDGRIDAHGPTLRALNRAERVPAIIVNPVHTPPPPPPPPRATQPAMSAASRLPHAAATPPRPSPVQHAPAHQAQPPARHAPAGHAPPRRGVRQPPADIIAAAQRSQRTWRVPASISLGQWALESGWGQSMPPASNNPFGIKARRGEPYVLAWTHEVINHRRVRVQARFRVFHSIDEAFDHHGRLLATYRPYAAARVHLADPDRFADALTGVYATDEGYGESLRGMMHGNDLMQYNLPAGGQ